LKIVNWQLEIPVIRFAEQEPDENIELFLRQHFITNVPWIVLTILAFIAPALVVMLDTTLSLNLFNSLPSEALVGGLIIWYMLILAYALEKFLFWYYNIYIVTNIHLVDIDFISLLFRQITEIEIKDVESVRTQISGVIRPLFNFGDVVIETAAKDQASTFTDVPKPDIVADRIDDLRQANPGGGE
jgi:hypothetical protein